MQRDESSSTAGPRADWIVCALLAVVTLGLYWQTRHFEFNNYDDAQYLTQNYHVQSGLTWESVRWAFTSGYASNWHPLTWLSHLLDWQLFGAHAGGHHLTGVLIHVADTVLLFLALRRLTGAFWPCAFVAALFGWHPMHVESVAWVAERKDVLSAFFAMLTLIAYAKYVREEGEETSNIEHRTSNAEGKGEDGGWRMEDGKSASSPQPSPPFHGGEGVRDGSKVAREEDRRLRPKFFYGLALVFFALGLMAKPMLVSLPLILLLLDYWPLCRSAEWCFRTGTMRSAELGTPNIEHRTPNIEGKGQERLAGTLAPPAQGTSNIEGAAPSPQPSPPMGAREERSAESKTPNIEHRTSNIEGTRVERRAPLVVWKRLVVEKVPFFALSFLSCVVTFLVQKHGSAVQSLEAAPLQERFFNAVVAYVQYVVKLLWPAHLSLIYPYSHHLPLMEVAVAFVLLLLVCLLVWRVRESHPWLLVGWAWFVIMLVPVIGLVQVGAQAMADRYSYLPSVGLFMALAWEGGQIKAGWLRSVAALFAALALVGCLAAASGQIGYWRNSVTLFSHTVEVTKDNAIAECDLSAALMEAGRKDEALIHLKQALRIDPNYVEALNNMGIFLTDKGKPVEAEDYFRRVLSLQPEFAPAHFQLGTALYQEGRVNEAADSYRAAIRFNPTLDRAHANLGIILSNEGQVNDAVEEFLAALSYAPNNAYAHNGLGRILESRGRMADAEAQYAAAVASKPEFAEAQVNLGVAQAARKDFAEATQHFEAALKVQPGSADVHYNFGNALAAQGKLDEAIAEFSEATRLQTNYLEAHFNLALALAQKGRFGDAVEVEKKALEEAKIAGKTNMVPEIVKRIQAYGEGRR